LQQEWLRKDEAARFFLELRNFSQKEGRVATVGSRTSRAGHWHFLFAGTAGPVPSSLLGRDVANCCQEHLSKLAGVVFACSEAFPWHSCPARALTDPGVEALGVHLDAVDASLGYPPGWSNLMQDRSGRIAVLRRHVDAVDFDFIRRVANHRPRADPMRDGDCFEASLGASLAAEIEKSRARGEGGAQHVRNGFVAAVFRSRRSTPDGASGA
jgi:hypothetical protein